MFSKCIKFCIKWGLILLSIVWKFIQSKQKMKFSIKDFFSKYDQIRDIPIWSRLLRKSLMKKLILCVAKTLNK